MRSAHLTGTPRSTHFTIHFLHVISDLHLLVLRVESNSTPAVGISPGADLMLLYHLDRAILIEDAEGIALRLNDDGGCGRASGH